MKKKILLEIFLSLFLAFMFVGNLWAEESIMHPDRETLIKWMNDHINAPKAQKDESIERMLYGAESLGIATSMDLLDHIEYVTADRNQGNCGNCWAWAGTGIMEIAHSVQNGVLDRLSVQYFNSCRFPVPELGISYSCCGGNLEDFENFFKMVGFTVPWGNTNAAFDDRGRGCADGSSLVSCASISKAPNYPINSIEALSIDTWNLWVDQAWAIDNIKNVLNQNKGVYFSIKLPDSASWNEFRSFWNGANGETEETLWNPNQHCDTPWNPDEGGGHGVLILGYNEDDADPANHYWLALNSWGDGSGTRPNGLFRIPMSINYKCVNPGAVWLSWSFSTLDVEFGVLPISNAGGPYTEECEDLRATVQLDGAGSSDPEGFPLQYSWITDCPGGAFSDATVANPILTIDASSGCIINCTVSLTVTDNGGLLDSDSVSVNIRDTIPPTITCPPDKSIECSASAEPSNTGTASSTDNCITDPPISYSDNVTPGSCPQAETISRTWQSTDACDNTASCSQTINVVDTVPPTLVGVPGNQTVQCDAIPAIATVTSTDNCDRSVDPSFNETPVAGNCAGNYTLTRTWTAVDDCDNRSSSSQTITVQDTVGPIISCNNPTTMTPPDAPTALKATAVDNCSDATTRISGYNCVAKKSKLSSCVVSISGDTITILNSGGVGDKITWTVESVDGCSNTTNKSCSINVVNPKKQ